MQHPALVIAHPSGPVDTPQRLTEGSIADMTFVGPGGIALASKVPALWYGGDFSGTETPTTNYQAELTTFLNVHIKGFGCGLEYGNGFQTTWINGSIESNGEGVCFQDGPLAIENINFHGTQFLNNIRHGINHNEHGAFVEASCYACSFDYNGQTTPNSPQLVWTNGIMHLFGGHFEGPWLPHILIPTPNSGVHSFINVSGTQFSYQSTDPSRPAKSFIEVDGLDDSISITNGSTFGSTGSPVTSIVNWATIGAGYNRLYMEPYIAGIAAGAHTIAAMTGKIPEQYDVPTFNVYGLRTGNASNVVAPSLVINGMAFPTAQGSYLGWNRRTGLGRDDFINNPGGGEGGFDFWQCDAAGQVCHVIAEISATGKLTSKDVVIDGLKGIGNAFACLNPAGQLYRSSIPCHP